MDFDESVAYLLSLGHETVAVKLVRADFASPDLVQRSRSERQILARLEHANAGGGEPMRIARDGEALERRAGGPVPPPGRGG